MLLHKVLLWFTTILQAIYNHNMIYGKVKSDREKQILYVSLICGI